MRLTSFRSSCAALCALAIALCAVAPHGGTPAHAAGDCTAAGALDSEETAFLGLINAYRVQNGRAPLAVSYTLSRASQWKSQDLGANHYFAHDDLDRTWVQRIRDCGYGYNTWLGENIAAGVTTAQAAFDIWKNSPGHNANMLGVNYTSIGIGRAYTAGSPYGWYWTTDFGGYDDGYVIATAPAPPPTLDAGAPSLTVNARMRGRRIVVTARAADADGIDRVEFFVDGARLAVDRTAQYRAELPAGSASIVVIAYDRKGSLRAAPAVLRR